MTEDGSELIQVEGRLEAFGFPTAPAALVLIARPRSWRMTRVLLALFIGWGIIPLVAFIPPHLPWIVLAFVGGIYFAWRYSKERYTLVSLTGRCPRCSTAIRQDKRGPLRQPHTLHCGGCGQELVLHAEV